MTDKIEIQGKTVNEAVSEALLRMGARRDEVNVKILEEPKAGFLGFLGGRQARVLVERRLSTGRGGRDRKGRPERNDQAGRRPADNNGGRPPRGGFKSADRGERRGDGRRDGRSDNRGDNRGENRSDTRSDSRGDSRNDSRNDGRREPRAEDRGRPGRESGRRPQGQDAGSAREPNASPRAQGPAGARGEAGEDARSSGSGRRRGGRGRGSRAGVRDADQGARREGGPLKSDEPRPVAPAEGTALMQVRPAVAAGDPSSAPVGPLANAAASPPPAAHRSDEFPSATTPAAMTESGEEAAAGHPAVIDAMIAQGLQCVAYAKPVRGIDEDGLNPAMTGLAGGMLVRAGFPCRCEVVPGEYRQVRVVTDDSSARILIGRHGATVDAVEHLVERMASTARGDRVKMNLDINNYRRRREDGLVSRVAEAVARVKATGQECHLEPMNARERRIVHLEAAGTKGLQTFTIGEEGDKHVVIAVDDGKPHPETAESAGTDMAAGDAARDDGQVSSMTGSERSAEPTGTLPQEPQA